MNESEMPSAKCYRFNQVPSDFHEPHIVSGYRPCPSSPLSCVLSAFHANNETLNIWTHFIPFLLFAWITAQHLTEESRNDPFTWPLLCLLISVCLYMLLSSVAHVFNTISVPSRYVAFFFDYSGISMYSIGTSIAYYAYIFPPELLNSSLYRIFLPVAMVIGVATTTLSCYSWLASTYVIRQHGRLAAFAIPFIWFSAPLVYRIALCQGTESNPDAVYNHVLQLVFVIACATCYGSHFPEVLSPGTFDIYGHSHQLFHVLATFSTYFKYRAQVLDQTNRREYLMGVMGTPTFANTFGVLLILLLLDLLIVLGFSYRVSQPHGLDKIKSKN